MQSVWTAAWWWRQVAARWCRLAVEDIFSCQLQEREEKRGFWLQKKAFWWGIAGESFLTVREGEGVFHISESEFFDDLRDVWDRGRKFELAREEEFCEAAIGELFFIRRRGGRYFPESKE